MTTPVEKSTPPPSGGGRDLIAKIFGFVRLPQAWIEHRWTPIVMMLVIGAVWSMLLTRGNRFDPQAFVVGEIAPLTIRSTSQLVIEDLEASEQAREKAAASVVPLVDYLETMPADLQQRTVAALAILRAAVELNDEVKLQVEQALGKPLDADTLKQLYDVRNDLQFENILRDAIGLMAQTRVASEPKSWTAAYPNGVAVRSNAGGSSQKLAPEGYRTILSVAETREFLTNRIQSLYGEAPAKQRKLVTTLVKLLVQPNMLPNPVETENARLAAREAVKPVYFQLKPGEVIVRSGERITPAHSKQLAGLNREQSRFQDYTGTLAKTMLLMLAVVILTPYSRQPAWRNLGHPQDLLLMLVLTSIVLIVIQTGRNLTEPLVLAVPNLPREAILLLMPFATVGMIFRLFFRPRNAVHIAVAFALALALFVAPTQLILPYSLLGGIVGIQFLKHSKRRSQFYRAGMVVGLVQSAVWMAYGIVEPSISIPEMFKALPFAFAGGLIASVLASTLMPLCELIGRYVSEIRLLEMTQDDQPLLKWLHLNAPGTYAHSLAVARLAETAAERIGADELLTRVGAYYHDIGKGYWPSYFVENQRYDNPHDKLKPQLSSRVIIAHVTHGAELARKNNIPPVIVDFILEHHGTSRVEYFFRQAQEKDADKLSTDDTTFRYPGPKPRSKETALVMLADVVESATRTLENPTADRIAAFVSRLIERIYAEDQLDEAPLTLHDLSTAKEAFTDVLTGMYHHRVDYPLGLKPGNIKPVDAQSA